MNIQINNTRELKSLYLLKNIRKLELFFKNPISCGVFVTCATLQPNLRIDTNEKFLTNNLKINKVSNKLIKIIFQDFSKEIVKNLLSGPIYLIEDDLILNRTSMKKFGLKVGEIMLFMKKSK